MRKSLGDFWFEHPGLLVPSIRSLTENVWRNNGDRWRVYCLSARADSILMWSHYAEKHRGICLEFGATGSIFGKALQVVYRDSLPSITPTLLDDPKALTETVLLCKSSDWSYESEYRLLARDSVEDPTFSATTDADFLKLPKGCLISVIAGCNADFEAVRNLVKECAPGIELKKAVRRGDRYEVEILAAD